MKMLMTFASATLLDRLLRWGDPAARALHSQRRQRARDGEESLRAVAQHHRLYESLHALECYSWRPPAFFRKVPGVRGAAFRAAVDTPNKGIREFLNISGFLHREGWPDETLVVKLTGRYLLRRPDFLEWCARSRAAAVVRRDDDVWGERGRGVHTFLFAASTGVLRDFAGWLRADAGPGRFGMKSIEWIFFDFLTASGAEVEFYPHRLHVLARYAPPLHPVET